MLVELNGQNFEVKSDEFNNIYHEVYNNLKIIPELGVKERIVSLLTELQTIFKDKINIIFYGISHGGFIPIKCSSYFDNVYVIEQDTENIKYNIESQNINNIFLNNLDTTQPFILYVEKDDDYEYVSNIISQKENIIVVSKFLFGKEYEFKLSNSDFKIYIPQALYKGFYQEFHFFIKDNFVLDYDNLIHLSMIVKNGGKDFEEMLTRNINLFDRWTILDTGSTDNTVENINRILVGKKKGELFQEPFINFRESRNRCLELCGQKCKFIIILDDTYVVEGKLREFLNIVRGDQFSNSFSLYIKSDDTEYCSNRIIKSENNLRYIHKIHEVITGDNNVNVCIPLEQSYVNDLRSKYMEKRTMDRKQWDLKTLFEMVEEEPDNPRHLYYIAHTYNLLEKYDLAYEYFLKRAQYTGFIQEQIDSYFEAGRLANFQLAKDWNVCFDLYMKSYELDNTRPDSMYFIGIHYYLEGDKETAFKYFKIAFEIGYPAHAQHSLKPTLSYHFLPKFLCELCYIFKDYKLGLKSASLFLEKNKPSDHYFMVIRSWYDIYKKLNDYESNKNVFTFVNNNELVKPILCFIADGGFNQWSGSSILKTGVGGSETFIIEMSNYLSRNFDVYVFCNCEKDEMYESVQYFHLSKLYSFLSKNNIHTCIVSRYTEYLPVCYENNIENVYLSLHDLLIDGTVIPINPKLKNVLCLSDSHTKHFVETFPCFKDITKSFNYGIDEMFFFEEQSYKVKNKFIYSSFPNRGLIQLFNMWGTIRERLKDASLHLYFDIDNKWVNENCPEYMKHVKEYLKTHNEKDGVYYHGWVDKKTLSEAWKTSSVWLYPCTFIETFCLSALECAASKTLSITTDLGSLEETAKNGIIIKGLANTEEWQTKALENLFYLLENENQLNKIIETNYKWAKTMLWKNRVSEFIKLLEPSHKFDYQNLYNWTNDLPKGTKKIFDDILIYHSKKYLNNECKILEIGTYTGTSLIQIMKKFQNPKATVIDLWKNYDEENNQIVNTEMKKIEDNNIKNVFIDNMIKANIFDKVTIIQDDSNKALVQMLDKHSKNSFDLIYVDGSHKLFESYTDIILSHFLLNKNGLLIIDDVDYNKSNILESPFKGIEYFLQKFGNSYKILSFGYRLFLEKI